MENEMFTFVVCSDTTHSVEHHYCKREKADLIFNTMIACGKEDRLISVAYYAASVGGLVNAWAQV